MLLITGECDFLGFHITIRANITWRKKIRMAFKWKSQILSKNKAAFTGKLPNYQIAKSQQQLCRVLRHQTVYIQACSYRRLQVSLLRSK